VFVLKRAAKVGIGRRNEVFSKYKYCKPIRQMRAKEKSYTNVTKINFGEFALVYVYTLFEKHE
jgi:hypothetical protein